MSMPFEQPYRRRMPVNGRLWTEKEIAILRADYPKAGAIACADRIERAVHSIRAKANTLGLKAPRIGKQRIDPLIRFLALTEKMDGCWNWRGSRLAHGYGRFGFGDEFSMGLAHRWAYEYFRGPIPAGMVINHLCRNRGCVNPDHLEVVTPKENQNRATPYRTRSTSRACAHGHPWNDRNAYISPSGKRTCRACRNESMARYKTRLRAA